MKNTTYGVFVVAKNTMGTIYRSAIESVDAWV